MLSQPIPGEYYDYIGISQPARMEYYARLRAVTARYAVPVVDCADHDDDVYVYWAHVSGVCFGFLIFSGRLG